MVKNPKSSDYNVSFDFSISRISLTKKIKSREEAKINEADVRHDNDRLNKFKSFLDVEQTVDGSEDIFKILENED